MNKLRIVLILLVGLCFSTGIAVETPQYTSPKPGARLVTPEASILVRFAKSSSIHPNSDISVTGSKSGRVQGVCKFSSDGHTLIFNPDQSFQPGEKINVQLGKTNPYQYSFTIAENSSPYFPTVDESKSLKPALKKSTAVGSARIMPNGVSVPSDFPDVDIAVNNNSQSGNIFSNIWRNDNPYNIIFDTNGFPVWYLRTPDGDRRRDFKVQDNGNLSMLVRNGYPFGQGWIEMDNTYTVVDSFYAVDGYGSDEHEFQLLEDGHYLLLGIRGVQVDMSRIVSGGRSNANVNEGCIQEFDENGQLIFKWPALEHLDPADILGYCTSNEADPRANSFRFPHMNAIDIDYDGHILLSCRHLSEVTKINRQTGEIIWRLGGANSDFDFVNDELGGFTMQHDIRSLGNNHYTVFDNGNMHSPQQSRGVEYELDLDNMTATLVWEYRGPNDRNFYTHYMGNTQRLPNGNTHINWVSGSSPKAMEVTPEGQVVYEMNFHDYFDIYRVFRFQWQGNAAKPYLLAETSPDRVVLIFNKFGDKNIKHYNIYADQHENPTTLIAQTATTIYTVQDLESGLYYFRVTAEYADGSESEYSNQMAAAVQFVEGGVNLIQNGDFENNADAWIWDVRGSAQADLQFEQGVAHFNIAQGGDNIYDIQIRQNGLPLIQGIPYIFEFDAWAANSRVAEIKVGQDDGSYTNYSRIGYTALATRKRHYTYTFTMNEATDLNARVVINTGTDAGDVYLDNLSLVMDVDTLAENPNIRLDQFKLFMNYPNPFNLSTTIRYELPEQSDVELHVYNIAGELVQSWSAQDVSVGPHSYLFNAANLASGIYIYSVKMKTKSGQVLSRSKKMTFLK